MATAAEIAIITTWLFSPEMEKAVRLKEINTRTTITTMVEYMAVAIYSSSTLLLSEKYFLSVK